MVTEISGAGGSHSMVAQAGTVLSSRTVDHVQASNPGITTLVASDKVSLNMQSAAATRVAAAFAQLQNRHEELNGAASVVREVEQSAEKASQLLNKMENELGSVVKMYPPYPVDSPERVQLLNNFGGLRKQIEALTFPPEDAVKAVGRVLSGQGNDKADNGSESEKAASLIKEPMWDISTLDPLTASDEDVGKALDQVTAMKAVVDTLQAGMWKDVVNFVNQTDPSAAEDGSSKIRNQLADLGDQDALLRRGDESRAGLDQTGIGRNAYQLVQAAELR